MKLIRKILRLRDEGMSFKDINVYLGLDIYGIRSSRLLRKAERA